MNATPSQPAAEVKFEIGHVLFIDIVGYSKLLINEQSEQLQKLKEIVRGTEQFRSAEEEGKLLRLPTGDGAALVFRTSPEAPVECAREISRALRAHPELRVRMGVHSGPVNEVSDLNEQANMAGAGINFAQRVMIQLELFWKGDTRPLHQEIDSILAKGPEAVAAAADVWFFCALAERDAAAAERPPLVALGDNPCWVDTTSSFCAPASARGLLARMMK